MTVRHHDKFLATIDLDIHDVLQYELCSYPPSIFETSKLLRKANKPQLVEAIVKSVSRLLEPVGEINDASSFATDQYVLDGGSLMHRVKWPKCYLRTNRNFVFRIRTVKVRKCNSDF